MANSPSPLTTSFSSPCNGFLPLIMKILYPGSAVLFLMGKRFCQDFDGFIRIRQLINIGL